MKHEKSQLHEISIFSLRNIARELGVYAPTKLKKNELIDEILTIENGEKQPCTPSKRGRPLKSRIEAVNTENDKTFFGVISIRVENNIKKEVIDCILKEVEKKLNEIL